MTKKALQFGDSGVKEENVARRIPNTAEIKSFIQRIHKKMEEMDDLKSDLKQLYDDAEEQGLDRKALKIVVRYKKKGISEELRHNVNDILEKSGEQMLFAFV